MGGYGWLKTGFVHPWQVRTQASRAVVDIDLVPHGSLTVIRPISTMGIFAQKHESDYSKQVVNLTV